MNPFHWVGTPRPNQPQMKRKNISLNQQLYWIGKKQSTFLATGNVLPNITLARIGDKDLKIERYRIAKEVGELLGFTLKQKSDLTQWKYRKTKLKYKINGRAYAYIESPDPDPGPQPFIAEKQ